MSGKSVLIVDDDELICEMLSSLLSLEGYNVVTANNGAIGLDALARQRFDLVLLDLVMPELDGVRFLRLLPSRVAEPPPVLIISASIARSAPDALKMPNVVGMIHKPPQPRDLLDKIAGALAGRIAMNG